MHRIEIVGREFEVFYIPMSGTTGEATSNSKQSSKSGPVRPLGKLGSRLGPPIFGAASFPKLT